MFFVCFLVAQYNGPYYSERLAEVRLTILPHHNTMLRMGLWKNISINFLNIKLNACVLFKKYICFLKNKYNKNEK